MIASTTKSLSLTASELRSRLRSNARHTANGTYASVVVSMFSITPFVKPSISCGWIRLATLASDFEMIFKPLLRGEVSCWDNDIGKGLDCSL